MKYINDRVGAVAVRMRIYDTSLCLINAHLSSGEAEGDKLKRHSDYLEILRRGFFPPDSYAGEPHASLPGTFHEVSGGIQKV